MTCNIRFDNPADGENAWPIRRTLLQKTLLKHSPDIIATQEGRFHQLKDLLSLLKDYDLVDHHRSWIEERMYPSFFIKKDCIKLLSSDDRWLSETPMVAGSRSFDSAFPRLMTWIKVEPKGMNKSLFLVNTHLDHIKQETRTEQIRVLINETSKIWDETNPIVILGDFNDSPDSLVRQKLVEKFPNIQDTWKLFNSVEETSHHAFTGEMQNGARIDWILADKRLKINSCFMDKTKENNRYPTDHFPVICHLNFE